MGIQALRQVTAIESQAKRGSKRVNVYLDGTFAFSLAEDVAARLATGKYLSDADVAALRREDGLHQVYEAALNLLTYRPRSVAELRSRLERKGFDPGMIEDSLARLEKLGMVGDKEFAHFWVENRQAHSPRGGRLLRMELRFKGIDRETIDSALPDPEDEESGAYRVALAKARSLRGLEWREFRHRLGDYLVRRGFQYETTGSVVRRVWSEEHGSPDEDDDEEIPPSPGNME
jgi:regulatory protein